MVYDKTIRRKASDNRHNGYKFGGTPRRTENEKSSYVGKYDISYAGKILSKNDARVHSCTTASSKITAMWPAAGAAALPVKAE